MIIMEDAQQQSTLIGRLKDFVKECTRVIKITKKPTGKEYKVVLLVSGAGILLIGAIGFFIHIIKITFFG